MISPIHLHLNDKDPALRISTFYISNSTFEFRNNWNLFILQISQCDDGSISR